MAAIPAGPRVSPNLRALSLNGRAEDVEVLVRRLDERERKAGPDERGLALSAGTLGLKVEPPRTRVLSLPWPPGASLVLWTDGLSSRLELSSQAGLFTHDPALVAATLHREHTRERDDATVVVIRHPERS